MRSTKTVPRYGTVGTVRTRSADKYGIPAVFKFNFFYLINIISLIYIKEFNK
jgi:hypothetical protein